jgi:NCS1 family nucleobase:cation symporter-1
MTASSTLETRSVEPVPASERHGKPWHLFGLWWTPNLNIVTLITGAIAIQIGLNFTWAVIAIVVGNGLGAIFMASHSAQGPRLWLPQMIQSRAQFGFLGNVLPSLVTIFDGVGYVALGFVVCAQALALLIDTSISVGILISGAFCLALVFFGYRIIHRYQRYLAPIVGGVVVLWTVQLLQAHPAHHAVAHVAAGDVILAISIFASYQLTWAPFVSDYSRYLPESASGAKVFWYTYLGSFLASTWGMVLGAGAASIALDSFSTNSLGYMIGRLLVNPGA